MKQVERFPVRLIEDVFVQEGQIEVTLVSNSNDVLNMVLTRAWALALGRKLVELTRE